MSNSKETINTSKYASEILRTVDMMGTISVQELSQLLGVSDQTIRRVSRPLAEQGALNKVHGALISTKSALDPPFLSRMSLYRTEKIAIANAVAQIISDGDRVAIDCGSTSAFIAQALRQRRDLAIVTNSAYVASSLAMIPGNKVSMAGTQLRDYDGASFDQSAFQVVEQSQVDYCILTASMISAQKGFLVHEQCEVDMAKAMMNSSTRSIMAVNATKFQTHERKAALRQPTLRKHDFLVTDAPPPEQFRTLIEPLNLVVAQKDN